MYKGIFRFQGKIEAGKCRLFSDVILLINKFLCTAVFNLIPMANRHTELTELNENGEVKL